MNPLQVAALVLLVLAACLYLYIAIAFRDVKREDRRRRKTFSPTDKDAQWARQVLAEAAVPAVQTTENRIEAIKALRAKDPALSLPEAARLVREVAGDA